MCEDSDSDYSVLPSIDMPIKLDRSRFASVVSADSVEMEIFEWLQVVSRRPNRNLPALAQLAVLLSTEASTLALLS